MAQQGTGKTAGYFARAVLGYAVNALLNYFHRDAIGSVSDTNTAELFDGEVVQGVVVLFDKTNNLTALVELQGDGNGTAILAQSGSHFATTSGNASTVNVYWNSDHYEVETQAGDVELDAIAARVP